jgi:hemerythrin
MTQAIINPEAIPHVALGFMNNTHEEEVDQVNAIGELVKAKQAGADNDTEISQQLGHWLEHTQAHFARENELMQETGFPAFPIHSNEHEIALERLQSVILNWEKNRDIDQLADYIFTIWPTWFNAHVNSMDMVTAQFATMNGFQDK